LCQLEEVVWAAFEVDPALVHIHHLQAAACNQELAPRAHLRSVVAYGGEW
jgi:hypothetical protein